jgi:myo-inositol 2-dehydrogenase/D-chiro-inositol 1-dehydrogenase
LEEAIRVALVGLGDIGWSAHLPALRRNTQVRLALVVDPDPARRALVNDVPTTADVDAVLADDSIRAVVLATPPWVTAPMARQFLEAGRFVLAEKPIAVSSAAAKALEDVDTSRLQVGLTYRHDPALHVLREWIAHGRLGSPLLVRAHIYDEARGNATHDARITEMLRHGSPAIHEGAHVFDWLRFLLGDPDEISEAWAVRTEPGLPAANLTGARLRYPDGTTALVEFGWLTDELPRCELTFLGARGLATLDGFTFALQLRTPSGTQVAEYPGERMTRSFDRQLARFVALLTGQVRRGEPNLDDALAALRTGERIDALA